MKSKLAAVAVLLGVFALIWSFTQNTSLNKTPSTQRDKATFTSSVTTASKTTDSSGGDTARSLNDLATRLSNMAEAEDRQPSDIEHEHKVLQHPPDSVHIGDPELEHLPDIEPKEAWEAIDERIASLVSNEDLAKKLKQHFRDACVITQMMSERPSMDSPNLAHGNIMNFRDRINAESDKLDKEFEKLVPSAALREQLQPDDEVSMWTESIACDEIPPSL